MSLKDLDEKLVPKLAEKLDRAWRRFPRPPDPNGPAPFVVRLRRIDDRFARRGPLALMRDVPQVGAVAIGALVLASGMTVASRTQPATQQRAPMTDDVQDPGFGDGTLGPEIGESVEVYLEETRKQTADLITGQPNSMVVAVVSFKAYRTPEQVRDLLGPIQARQIFYRAPMKLPNGIVRTTGVADVVKDGRREFDRVAQLRRAEARELRKVAATIENDPAQKTEHEKDAGLAEREAELLAGRCACVFGLVVQTRLRLLVDLFTDPAVRAVDAAQPGAQLRDFTFTALLPEEKVTVTGGNESG